MRMFAGSLSRGEVKLAKRLKIPFWTVDADVVVPSAVFVEDFCLAASLSTEVTGAVR